MMEGRGYMVVGDWCKMSQRERCFEVRTLRPGHFALLKGGNLHGLISGRHGQGHFEINLRSDRDLYILIEGAESAVRRLNAVGTDGKKRKHEQAIRVTVDGEGLSSGIVGGRHLAVGEDSARGIVNGPGDGAPACLREGSGAEREAKGKHSE